MATQKIRPCLWVEKDAMAVANYYCSIFKDGQVLDYNDYKGFQNPGGGSLDMAVIRVLGMELQILAAGPLFQFNEALSLAICCTDQAEVDYYWEALTQDGGQAGPCGWLKDKYGLSWQVVPERCYELEKHPDDAIRLYALNAVMQMGKIIIADLEQQFGNPAASS
ncbi:MAG: VOC family protein [Bacteroidetes bacterium]|nr:VOC family protein [Bacteroidota bacterium]